MIRFTRHCLGLAVTALLLAVANESWAAISPDTYDRSESRISEPDWLPDTGIEENGFGQASVTSIPTSIYLTGTQNFTLSGAPGATVTISLKNFVLNGDATFTLDGTATTKFIINVGRRFSLSGNSAITLSGGVDLTNVLFKISRKGSAVVTDNAVLRGIISAPQRQVRLSRNALVYGRVTGRKVILSGNARIIPPPPVSQ